MCKVNLAFMHKKMQFSYACFYHKHIGLLRYKVDFQEMEYDGLDDIDFSDEDYL